MNYSDPETIRKRLDDILPRVEKPARYFAGEIGLIRKPWENAAVRMAVAFPDVYEIAVANLGHRLILRIVNSQEKYLAERVYSPWPDMEKQLRDSNTPLYSLESLHPVASFDILGVSLTHELGYTNFLQIIDLSGLPLKSSERGFPIVIAGGPAVFNPEPVADFVDAFVLGDGEEVVLTLLETIERLRDRIDEVRGSPDNEQELKQEILDLWGGAGGGSPIQGVYIPRHFNVNYSDRGEILGIENTAGGPDKIYKALVSDLDSAAWEIDPFIPHVQGVSHRVTVEPARGCTHGCRFCHAGMVYRPYRERSLDVLLEQAEALLKATGLQEQSFLALSATDWPHLREFIARMKDKPRDFHLRISLPSNRIAALDNSLTDLLISNRKGGLTLAIEAATPRLRAVINKDITGEDIENAVTNALESGWDLLKLYFMIGLPSETDDDVLAIISLADDIRRMADRLRSSGSSRVGRLKLKISVSSFVPKAHTPFQWAPMDVPETLDRKQKMLTGMRRFKGVDYSSHDIDASWIESIMSRGDRKLSAAIEKAYRNGARFDAWSDMCDIETWKKAFDEAGIDADLYLGGRDVDAVLPWDHLSCGVDKEWLKEEWLRSLDEMTIPDCNESTCHNCGMHYIHPACRPIRLGNHPQKP